LAHVWEERAAKEVLAGKPWGKGTRRGPRRI